VDPSRWFGPIDPRLDDAGETIVFSYQGALWRMPRSGGAMTRLTGGPGFDIAPAWSPDGKRIAFIRSASFAAGALRLIRADDGSELALPRPVAARGKLEFDRSGARVLGVLQEAGRDLALAWFDLDTGRLDPVPAGLPRPLHFALSRDGRSLAMWPASRPATTGPRPRSGPPRPGGARRGRSSASRPASTTSAGARAIAP
jgi:hypothetical protein